MGRARLELRVSSLVLVRNSTKQLILLLPVRIKTEAQIMLSRLLFAVLLTAVFPASLAAQESYLVAYAGFQATLKKVLPAAPSNGARYKSNRYDRLTPRSLVYGI